MPNPLCNPLLATPRFSIAAQPIIETVRAVGEQVEDWSACRSPARARRREKRGFKQHVRRFRKPACYEANGTFFIHPELARELRKEMSRRMDRRIENDLAAALQAGDLGLMLSKLGYKFSPPPSSGV